MMNVTSYSESFYREQLNGSSLSASIVVPLFLAMFKVSSVIDVGCGVGTWLRSFIENGISDCIGLDGNYVPRNLLVVSEDSFKAVDLTQPIELGRRFDAACSLEVAEHLPPACAERFVDDLVKLAPVVLFSAAIPGQGGTHHINEQWQSYWADKFAARGYVAVDCIRPHVFGNDAVEFWYRQNALVFCRPDRAPNGAPVITGNRYELDRVHPEVLARLVEWYERRLSEEREWHAQAMHEALTR